MKDCCCKSSVSNSSRNTLDLYRINLSIDYRIGDLCLRGGEGERLLSGDSGLLRGGVSPRLTGEGSGRRRIGGESGRRLGDGGPGGRLGDSTLRFGGDRFRGGEAGFFRGDAARCM